MTQFGFTSLHEHPLDRSSTSCGSTFFSVDLGSDCIPYRPESSLSSYLAHAGRVSVVLAFAFPAHKQ